MQARGVREVLTDGPGRFHVRRRQPHHGRLCADDVHRDDADVAVSARLATAANSSSDVRSGAEPRVVSGGTTIPGAASTGMSGDSDPAFGKAAPGVRAGPTGGLATGTDTGCVARGRLRRWNRHLQPGVGHVRDGPDGRRGVRLRLGSTAGGIPRVGPDLSGTVLGRTTVASDRWATPRARRRDRGPDPGPRDGPGRRARDLVPVGRDRRVTAVRGQRVPAGSRATVAVPLPGRGIDRAADRERVAVLVGHRLRRRRDEQTERVVPGRFAVAVTLIGLFGGGPAGQAQAARRPGRGSALVGGRSRSRPWVVKARTPRGYRRRGWPSRAAGSGRSSSSCC